MKRSKIMKTINKHIAGGHKILNKAEVKKMCGKVDEEALSLLTELGCDVQENGDAIIVTLTRTYDELEIDVEEQIEKFEEF